MNKFLTRILIAILLALPVAGFCADANRVGAKAPAGEQALWDKINSLRGDVETFQREKGPVRPRRDANETEIRNYLKAVEVFKEDILKHISLLLDASKEYYGKYPKGIYAKENFKLLPDILGIGVSLNKGVMRPEDETVYNKLCKDENLTYENAVELFLVNLSRLQSLIEKPGGQEKPDKKTVEPLIGKMEAQIKEFGGRFKTGDDLLTAEIMFSEQIRELYPERSKQILELAKKYATEDGKKRLDGLIRSAGVIGSKPEIKFKAVDGNEVDLSKMKGKVVLIDFWATWCGPCMMELPNVLNVYKKYHDKGFEIIGISFDKDIESLRRVTKERGMTWPQYFDGRVWDNRFGVYYGINAIPAMWLVDKDGKVVDTGAYGPDLGDKVEKLLSIKQ
jgi:thiol-disulfide isomerase/thioredoxin